MLSEHYVLITFTGDSTTEMKPLGEIDVKVLCTMLADSLCLAIAQAQKVYPHKAARLKEMFLDHIKNEVE